MANLVQVMSHKTRPHIERLTYSINKRRNTQKEDEDDDEEEEEEEKDRNVTIRDFDESDAVFEDESRQLLRQRWSTSDEETNDNYINDVT